MANDINKIFEQAKQIAAEDDTYFIEDVVGLLPISKTTFYDYFKLDSNEMNDIKRILNNNRIEKKKVLRSKLAASDKAAEVLALYKLIGTDEERKKLSQGYVDVTTQGDKLGDKITLSINFDDFSDEEN